MRNWDAGSRVVLSWLIFTLSGLAQQPAKDLGDASLEELTNIQVFSASKRMQTTREAPSSVTVVTADEIQKFGYRTLADILRSVPGFYVTYDRNYSFAGVRGFARLGDWNSRVLLLVDGHRINTNTFGQAMLGTEFPVDVDLIQRVEIVRGPSSSLYGSNAFFAVINVVTRSASELGGGELSFEAGSFDTYKGRASYGGRYRGIEMMLSATLYNSAGQALFFPEFNSPATNHGIVRNADDEEHQHVLASLRYGGFTFQGMFSQREKGTPTAYFGTVFNDPRTRNFDDHQYFDLSYQHGIGERWQLEARTSYDQYRLVAPLAMAAPTPGGPTGVDKYSDRGNWWTGELRLSTTLWHKHRLTFGTEIRDNLRQDQGLFLSASSTFEQDLTSSWNWATYAQDEYEITRKLSLSVGVRHDGYPQGTVIDMLTGQPAVTTPLPSFGGATNPRVGLIYHPYQKTTLKFLYGSAFRAPKVFETTPDIGGFVVDNLALKPETIKSLEAVAEQELGQRFTLWGSVFQSRIRNLITLETDPGSGQLAYRNSQKAVATGTEVGLTARWASGLQGAASFSFVDGDDGGPEDQELPNSPRHIAKLNLSVPLIGKRLFAGLEGQYIGARHTVAGNTLGGFQVFNVTLLGHTLGRHLDLSGSLYNILDKRYADPGRPEDPEDSIQQDGRNFRIKITGRF